MWLALLLAAADDTVEQRGRRAALHEVRQRLFPVHAVRGPSFTETLIEFARRFSVDDGSDFPSATDAEWSALLDQAYVLIGEVLQAEAAILETVQWFQVPALANRGGDGRFLYLPPADALEFHDATREHQVPQPRTHTQHEAFLRFLLWEWAGDQEWDPREMGIEGSSSTLYNEMITHLPSVMDWVTALHPDLTGLDWHDVLLASQTWHRRFVQAGFGSPCAPALVVLRWPDGWTLQRLTEKKDFAREGTSMGHCIGGPDRGRGVRDGESSYWQSARDDVTRVFSLRDPDGRPQATVEMRAAGRVNQVQGPRDGEPSPIAMTKLREAFWAIGVYPGQRQVPRLGAPLVTEADLRADSQFKAAQAGVERIEADLQAEARETARVRPLMENERVWKKLASMAAYWTHQRAGLVGKDEPTAEIRPRSLPASATSLGGVYLGDTDTRLLMGFVDGTRLRFATGLAHGPSRLVLHRSVFAAFKALTGLPNPPPDVTHLEVLPGVPVETSAVWTALGYPSSWARIHTPLAPARQQRATQAAILGFSRRVS